MLRSLLRHFSDLKAGRAEVEAALQKLQLGPRLTQLRVAEGGQVTVQLKLDQDYRKTRAAVLSALKQVPWVKDPQITVAAEVQATAQKRLGEVKHVVAVSSCKGGVGKSTVAVNLAYSLARLGLSVGIYDADIYGPSLPTLVSPKQTRLLAPESDPKAIIPLDFEGVKLMSYGFAVQKRAVFRGPIVSALTHQLLTSTLWGKLDYLIVDMPPGTGDIPITLCQEVALSAAVIVTTPQKLSFVDVIKGIEMFSETQVPTVAVVENMSYFRCGNCQTKHRLFGPGYINQLVSLYGIKNSLELPMDEDLAKYSDAGVPLVLVQPESALLPATFRELASKVVSEIDQLKDKKPPKVEFDPSIGDIKVTQQTGETLFISPYTMRMACKCAACVNEFSGQPLLKPESVPLDVHPLRIETKGNYAVAVVWSDGHRSSVYPYTSLLALTKAGR